MAYFKIEEPNKEVKWVKKVNGADGTLEFTDNINEAYYQDAGFFADSEKGFLEFHFMEAYPELQYMTIDNNYYSRDGDLQGMAFVDAVGPQMDVVEEAAPQVEEAWDEDEAPAPVEVIG
jgi:hypothetical protein